MVAIKKPFVVILNCKNPQSEQTIKLASEMENKYAVPVIPVNVAEMSSEDISGVMENVLMEFPMLNFVVELPKWMQALPLHHMIGAEKF